MDFCFKGAFGDSQSRRHMRFVRVNFPFITETRSTGCSWRRHKLTHSPW